MSTVVSMFIILCIIIYCIRCSPTYIFLTLLVPRLFMYKMFHGLHPIGISAMYSQNCDVHSHDTRKKNNLHVAIGHSDLYAKSFYCTSIIIWNNIMNKINIAVSFPKFKKLLKSYLHCNTLNM